MALQVPVTRVVLVDHMEQEEGVDTMVEEVGVLVITILLRVVEALVTLVDASLIALLHHTWSLE